MKILNFLKKKSLTLPREHDEKLIKLSTKWVIKHNPEKPLEAITERREVWSFIADIFPETLEGIWEYDIPAFRQNRIKINKL